MFPKIHKKTVFGIVQFRHATGVDVKIVRQVGQNLLHAPFMTVGHAHYIGIRLVYQLYKFFFCFFEIPFVHMNNYLTPFKRNKAQNNGL